MRLGCLILAAGEGKRMKSALPKPLHKICGRPMIEHVLKVITALNPEITGIVIGVGREQLAEALKEQEVTLVVQEQQRGTGHAVLAAKDLFADFEGDLLVTCADIPLVRADTLQALLKEHRLRQAAATVLTAIYDNPAGYGRIVRDAQGFVQAIVEDKDASHEILAIREINAGIYCFRSPTLYEALQHLQPNNVQGEYYLTDVIAYLRQRGQFVAAVIAEDSTEVLGINDRVQLAQAEAIAGQRIREALMRAGVTMLDPATTYIEADVEIGPDTILMPGTILQGATKIGSQCVVGPHVHIANAVIGEGCQIRQGSIISESKIGNEVTIGPYAYVRPQCHIQDKARIGAHTEIVRARVGAGTKISHFCYVGDSEIGAGCNIGAGVVTCNYDGFNKHQTIIEDGAFVGSDAILVAPVIIGRGAYVAAGSVITKNVAPDSLAIERTEQKELVGWTQRYRLKAQAQKREAEHPQAKAYEE